MARDRVQGGWAVQGCRERDRDEGRREGGRLKVLVIDNYDSFVYNLAQYVGELGGEPEVFRNDEITLAQVKDMAPERIVISPGPGHPADAHYFGVCEKVLKEVSPHVPTLGVCLGHQGIGTSFGGTVSPASRLMHGKTSLIVHDGQGLLKGVKNPFQATRYHSLAIQKDDIPEELKVTALSLDDAEVMGVRHRKYPIEGVQFHPESIMTGEGKKIIKNF
ncbi:MAG TPA: aminodeoxychorismate/anthranilate synthase component II, partial [Nitrososphaerales archaeon]|nr:aminodeoxychorismate/anthranilate synthase component II [Nitrososphaerales archaeon]